MVHETHRMMSRQVSTTNSLMDVTHCTERDVNKHCVV